MHWSFPKLFYVGMFLPSVSMQDDNVLREIEMSPVVTDVKALFEAARNMSATQGLSAANKRTAIDVKIVCERMSRFNGQWYWTNTLQQVSDGLTKVQARQRLVEILRRGYHALKFDSTFTAGKKLTTEQRQQRDNELHQAAGFGANILCCDEVLLTSEASGSVSLRGMSMCDAGYSGRTVKIVKELREKFDLARSDHNSPFAHPVCCMDPLRLTLHKIYAQHVPTQLSRVDKILSKHEGHGQLLLCASRSLESVHWLPLLSCTWRKQDQSELLEKRRLNNVVKLLWMQGGGRDKRRVRIEWRRCHV